MKIKNNGNKILTERCKRASRRESRRGPITFIVEMETTEYGARIWYQLDHTLEERSTKYIFRALCNIFNRGSFEEQVQSAADKLQKKCDKLNEKRFFKYQMQVDINYY